MLAISILEFIGKSLWGFSPNLMKDIVDIHGSWNSIFWFMKNMPKYEKILKEWGAVRTHSMTVAISGINGCRYCTYGHALSFQLHYFEKKKELFPIDEQKMMELCTNSEEEIFTSLTNAFKTSGLDQEKKDLDRLIELKETPNLAVTVDDHRINHLMKMFAFLNMCGIKKSTKLDFAHDPINKKSALQYEYQNARNKFD